MPPNDFERGARVIVGGVDYAAAGWSAFEVARRRARRDAAQHLKTGGGEPAQHYGGRTYIHADDAIRSIVGARRAQGRKTPLQRAALHLADALGPLEEGLRSGWAARHRTLPALTSAEMRAFADDPALEVDSGALYDLGQGVAALMLAVGAPAPAPLPNLPGAPPAQAVTVADDEAVLLLEAAVEPHAASLEGLQAALAERLSVAADAVSARATLIAAEGSEVNSKASVRPSVRSRTPERVRTPERSRTPERGRPHARTRGEELDAAARAPPTGLLKSGLPADWSQESFDLRGGEVVRRPYHEGLYYGISNRDAPGRDTLLTPQIIAMAAFSTSGRLVAWVVLDSPEACYALRAPPRNGRVATIDREAIVAWIRPRLTGKPPHKLEMGEYIAYVRSLGVEVHKGPRRGDGAVRFDLRSMTTEVERDTNLSALRALTPADFEAFDWGPYDRTAAGEACSSGHEVSGDVAIDLVARKISAPKVRPGTISAARSHMRSYVTFHTHPAGRYQGSQSEPPSPQDVLRSLALCAQDLQAWDLVSAPEGTYIMRPSRALAAAYLHDPKHTAEAVSAVYDKQLRACLGTALECADAAIRALGDAGFVAHLRKAPCLRLPSAPDLWPALNRKSREESRAAYAAIQAMKPAALLAVDWGAVTALADAPALQDIVSWITANLRGGRAVPDGEGHMLTDVDDPSAYPTWPTGPLFVVYFPTEDAFPGQVPHAAVRAAKRSTNAWAWAVFLSRSRITIFRASPGGVEIHGPMRRAPVR